MSDNLVMQNTLSNQENSAVDSSVSAGQMLKQARIDAGLHIAALAVSLRVPVKRIEALENGQMDLLPDMVFVRALTSSICQALKIDALPILDKLPKAALPRLYHDDIAINTPIGSTGANNGALLSDFVSSPWLMGMAFLCIAAAGIYFWPKVSSLAVSEIVTPAKTLPDSGITQAKEQLVTAESTTNILMATPATAQPSSDTLIPTSAVISPMTDIGKSNSVANSALSADSIVVFKASGETWVEVKNAAGSTMFKKLLKAGETAGANGTVPLTVIVGRADATQVEVRGKPVDLMSIAKSNVARFEVN